MYKRGEKFIVRAIFETRIVPVMEIIHSADNSEKITFKIGVLFCTKNQVNNNI